MFHPQQAHPPFPKENMYAVEIQRVLDCNASIIHLIIDSQHKGKTDNLIQYMGQLHANLMWLTKQASINYQMEHGAAAHPSAQFSSGQGIPKSHPMHPSPLPGAAVPSSIPLQAGVPQSSISFAPAQTPSLPHAQSMPPTSNWDRPTSPSPLPSGHNPFDFSPQWTASEGYAQRVRASAYMQHQEGVSFPNHHRAMNPIDGMGTPQRQMNPSLSVNMYKPYSTPNYSPSQAMGAQPRHSGQSANSTTLSVAPPYTPSPMGHTGLPHMQGMQGRINSQYL